MKFVAKNQTDGNISQLMRKLGYHFMGKTPNQSKLSAGQNEKTEQLNFIRSLSQDFYPRFHLYLKENEKTKEITFNLHLDQRRPRYKGATAHNADYEGELVEKEAKRIKQVLS